ncbi:uncharacterized protein LOC125228281 isoform X2 [Leguminivora glycinivorella]|uniref:uncharacterized protein LOC125228281 isoform X2 n=1 Tax=Leguminivora glycinivorella TaxID=1035111 RepID=UPI00200CC9EF|nr:uncharacterized protein LOC125228281 isoform X2 [Leguminivora glycinivorella]
MVGAILGLQFDIIVPDMFNYDHQTPEFRKIYLFQMNPMCTIPVLKDGNLIVSESHAIILYLLNKYGSDHRERLYPPDPSTRATVDQCLYFDAGVLFLRMKAVTQPTFLGPVYLDGPTKKHISDIEEGYSIVEAYLNDRIYVAAHHLTIADISIGSTVSALKGIYDLDDERLTAHGTLTVYFRVLSELLRASRCQCTYTADNNMRLTKTLFNQACSTTRLVLYKRDASPPSNAVRMVGVILGLQFDYVEPDLIKGEHKSPEFRKINPMATIPVLKDGNLTVSESHAIILYLLNKYGSEHKEKLYPSDPATRAIVDQCLYFDAGVLFHQILAVSRPSFSGKSNGPSKKNIFDIEEGYAILEAYLESRPYVAAEHLTVADISLGTTTAALQGIHAVDANKFPKTKAWLERISAESYFKEFSTPGAALLAKMLRHFWKQSNK